MKKNTNMKLSALVLTSVLSLSLLTACTQNTGTAAAPSQAPAVSESPAGSVGTVLLSVNPEIEMAYNGQGNVVSLTGRNADGQAVLQGYSGYEGKACTTVVSELVEKIDQGGYFDSTIQGHEKNIVLKLGSGAQSPSDDFLEELAQAVRVTVEEEQIGSRTMALDQDDYDDAYEDRGYINAAAAQELLSAQMGRDDLQFVEKDYDLDDGDYEVEFVMDGVEYEYEVDAVTGKITEMDVDAQNDDLYDDRDDGLDDVYDDRDDGMDDMYDDRDDGMDDMYDDRDDGLDDVYDDRDDGMDDMYDDRDDDWDDAYDDHDDDRDDMYDDMDDHLDDDWDD